MLGARARRAGGRWLWLTAPMLAIALAGSASGASAARSTLTLPSAAGHQASQSGGAEHQAGASHQSLRWSDAARQTTLVLQSVNPTEYPSGDVAGPTAEFVFTLANGIDVTGVDRNLTRIDRHGTFAQFFAEFANANPNTDNLDDSATFCGSVQVQLPDGVGPNGTVAQTTSIDSVHGSSVVSLAALVLHIGSSGLLAYAGLAPVRSFDGCFSPHPTVEMFAGCTSTPGPAGCTSAPPPTRVATDYAGAFTAAVRNGDWSQVYAENSSVIRGQYTAAQFGGLMRQDAQQLGTITGISAPSSQPQIQYLDDGQAYFVATQMVSYTNGGSTHTRAITSYFLLEGGIWHFWFSK